MAITNTTLASACAVGDTSIVVASATGFTANFEVVIDNETMTVDRTYVSGTTIPVRRGVNGGYNVAHPSGAKVRVAASSDQAWGQLNAPQTVTQYPVAGKARMTASYTAAGAITLPTTGNDMVAMLNGTSVLAMTVADPGTNLDGSLLWIASNGAAAHTITFATGLSGTGASGSYDVITVNASAPVLLGPFMAVNGLWQMAVAVPMAGTVTNITATVS